MKKFTTEYVAMNPRLCTACWECVEKCPKKVIGKAGCFLHRHTVFKNADACIGCGKCIKTCHNSVFLKLDKTVSANEASPKISFRIERLLPLAFIASAVTGIGMHIAGHGTIHSVWHNWGVAHISASSLWLLSAAVHVKRHRFWYKALASRRITDKLWINIPLSLLFLIVAITGVILITHINGANSSVGLFHYKLGILLLLFSLIHVFYRK